MTAVPVRDLDLRLARLHLRTGSCALARSELEALAGSDRLDHAAILDLAEVRWRTGDLPGAAAAAGAWLDDGDEPGPGSALAHAIRAEAAAERGAADEAAGQVAAAIPFLADGAALEDLLAGISPRAPWPWAPEPVVGDESEATDFAGVAAGAADRAAADRGRTIVSPLAPTARGLVDAGRALLQTAPERATVLLALALRADRASAEAVLELLGSAGHSMTPALAFLRAEALRAAGRHDESRIAYASAERLARASAEDLPPGGGASAGGASADGAPGQLPPRDLPGSLP